MVLGNFPVMGHPTYLDNSRARPTFLARLYKCTG